ncbi:hypothetical protein [Alkalicoccobacillus plakortidis]|uniref:DUF4825 domain-containing protein n=1 Tax=Alkalicoccobacillus plakortidis TaxID=444060 RepID=A0ABT0XIK6_9BACI|nr:hypothetical protein [Alkalicoccobacillus plakortidis]MCM2675740.1 hypothetical protein [Alkalicoccobacillus plakortidis]
MKILPERFGTSYQYFLAQLGETKDSAKTVLNGADENEMTDNYGFTYMNFPHESFTIKFDEKNIAVAIVVDETIDSTNLVNSGGLYLINGYDVLVNSEGDQMSFTRNND